MTAQRRKADFPSAGSRCAAWHYPGENGACVIMAAGLAVIKEAGTDRLARRFHDAGYTVLAFDYRRLGESGGVPRQLVRIGDQLADGTPPSGSLPAFPASTATNSRYGDSRPLADTLPAWLHTTRVLPRRSLTRHLPTESTPCTTRSQHTTPRALARLAGRAAADTVGGLVGGGDPLLVPLAGERGMVASLTTPDSRNGASALNPGDRHPAVATKRCRAVGDPCWLLPARPIRSRIRCPLLVVAYGADGVAPPQPAIRAAQRARPGQLALLPGGHYTAFLDGEQQAAQVMLAFLDRELRPSSAVARTGTRPPVSGR